MDPFRVYLKIKVKEGHLDEFLSSITDQRNPVPKRLCLVCAPNLLN